MQTITNVEGQDIAIATLRYSATEESVCVSTEQDLALLVQAMGWDSLAAFLEELDVTVPELLDRYFCIVGGRLFMTDAQS